MTCDKTRPKRDKDSDNPVTKKW